MIAPGSELSIARQAKLLGVSRSSVYYHPKPESKEELELLKRLDELFTENPMYGSRRLQQMLKREGALVGRRRIRRLMRKLGLWALGPKPNTSKAHPEHKSRSKRFSMSALRYWLGNLSNRNGFAWVSGEAAI